MQESGQGSGICTFRCPYVGSVKRDRWLQGIGTVSVEEGGLAVSEGARSR